VHIENVAGAYVRREGWLDFHYLGSTHDSWQFRARAFRVGRQAREWERLESERIYSLRDSFLFWLMTIRKAFVAYCCGRSIWLFFFDLSSM